LFDAQDGVGNLPKHRPNAVFLHKVIGAIACQTWDFVGEIDVPGLFKELDFVLRSHFVQHLFEVVIFKTWIPYALEFSVHTENRL
jgi:hypothetical protein